MRILFLTNFYQVNRSGGEAQSCRQVLEGLQQRGHATLVLTSMDGTDKGPVEAAGICRYLYLEMDLVPWRHSLIFFTQRKARERHNLRVFEQTLEQFTPDIIFIWGMWNLPRSLAALAETRYPDKVVYRFATYWPTLPSQHEEYWRAPARSLYSRLVKQVLGRVALAMLARERTPSPLTFEHAICVSDATRTSLVEAGIPVANARVIRTGVDSKRFLDGQPDGQPNDGYNLNLLYAGRLEATKGVDTAIRALEMLVTEHHLQGMRLSVVGSDWGAGYESYLRQIVTAGGLDDYVTFAGHVPAEEMPQLLRRFDVLLVPSTWAEPFSRMLLEGMSSGLVVVATPTGGTTEILVDGENGLLFAPGDANDLAQKLIRLAADPELRRRLARAGRQTVIERFTSAKMMDEIESYLQEVAHAASPARASQAANKPDALSRATSPEISVIIPTYNRKGLLHETLHSLSQQTYPSDRIDVVIVDDGSTDGTAEIAAETFPFRLRYFRQSNQGDAEARNLGALQSQAKFLVFLDDDMLLEPGYLTSLIQAHAARPNRIVVGTWNLWQAEATPFTKAVNDSDTTGAYYAHSQTRQVAGHSPGQTSATTELPFRDAYCNNLSIRREAYFKIGMMQSLDFSGSSMWCDLDFAYRAHQLGFEFLRSVEANCWHRDHAATDLDAYKRRMRTAACRAVALFRKYPDLPAYLPMFVDKSPISWRQDPPRLIARKLARSVASCRPALWGMEQIAIILEQRRPAATMLTLLYRYIIGGHIFQGYREGLRTFKPMATPK
jgi:glycosyltransferase involved in cell wall biosynthesis/GT2 family glycosyltransferase